MQVAQTVTLEQSLVSFVPLAIYSVAFGVIAFLLAREKGRNVPLWTILGCIPLVNIFCLGYFVGSPSKKLEAKLDAIITRLESGG